MARLYTRQEVAQRTRRDDAALIIDNVVYGVAGFLQDHPGGAEVLEANAGKDASKCFRDVGHSEDAKLWRMRFRIGEVVPEERWEVSPSLPPAPPAQEAGGGLLAAVAPPLLVAALAVLVYTYLL